MKKIILSTVIVIFLFILLIPVFKIIYIRINSFYKSYTIEIEDKKEIERYVFQNSISESDTNLDSILVNNEKNLLDKKQNKQFTKQANLFFEKLISEYQIIEDDFRTADNWLTLENKKNKNEINQSINLISRELAVPILGDNNLDIIGDIDKLEILHTFDDTLENDIIPKNYQKTPEDKIALLFDQEGGSSQLTINEKREIESYISKDITRLYRRASISIKTYKKRKFTTSPVPLKKAKQIPDALNKLRLIMEKDQYYSFEIIRYNLISQHQININDLKIYIRRGKLLINNVGGKNDFFFKYRNNQIVGTTALGYNVSPGKYYIIVKSKSNPQWKGIVNSFQIIRRNVPKLNPGFSVVNMEHTIPLKRTPVISTKGNFGDYKEIVNWLKYMDVDAFWMLVAQTTGWNSKANKENPWNKGGFINLDLLAPEMHKAGILVGGYIMSYFTPGNGKKKIGYDPSLGYDSGENQIQDSYHISLNCEQRFQDILNVARSLEKNPYVDFIGMDFIRTGRADGYEMGPLVVEDMNIKTPQKYYQFNDLEKIKWFANQIENVKNQSIIKKWRWWRAHKTASIINRLIIDGNLTKPIWVFTLGWEHGKQHGQDPYMMFDAGAFVDAVMLYEASEAQFKNMMYQWNNYMRDNKNNLVIGNSSDIRLLESISRNTAADFMFRQIKGYRKIYRNGLAKGIFFHDISRALWSSKRGIPIYDWAIVNGSSTSEFRFDSGVIPYKIVIDFNLSSKEEGVIKIINPSKKIIRNLSLQVIKTPHWDKITTSISSRFITIKPNSTLEFSFKAKIKPKYQNQEIVLGCVAEHPRYRKYFAFTQYANKPYNDMLKKSLPKVKLAFNQE